MRRAVVIQLVLFVVVGAAAVTFGIRYVIGPQSLGGAIEVSARMSDAFGLSPGTAVTYRGVGVGKVTAVDVGDDGRGVVVRISLDPGTEIPMGSTAAVTNASALGIQSLDITPTTDRGPFLADGGTLTVPADKQPEQLDQLLGTMSRLVGSIDPNTITELSDTMGTALTGTGPQLRELIADADRLSQVLQEHAPALASMVDAGLPLLDTLAAHADGFPGSAAAVRNVADQLVASEPSLIYLTDHSPSAMAKTQQLLDSTHGDFGSLLTNMVTVGQIVSDRTPALAAGLVSIPDALGKLGSVVHGGRADFTLVGTQGPLCYYDTPRRSVGDVSPRNPNLALYCPPGKDLEQRGSRVAPRPNDLGLQNATEPGRVTGPPMVDDPILVPTGQQAVDYWKQLLQGIGH
ncbi:MCE family protein [Rhodococcus sp. D2-41]|uniref:MCE family protein n=1 Tax=Speluncibacter jeojiensis TaxID=2710754 RepID=A0A9X4M1Q2_9ACTN|nr:MlaD family protein [Rhodococcus sp. D2-41]MDG3009039.1 MCE family protein [Rhodococcus sp. D2-41]MDG3015551.1 MCE family protein [Corynebacteriales bacterium D3-21]